VGVLVAYFVIRLLKSDDPHWWVAIGAAIGLGMLTKYTMSFLVSGVVGGVLLTPARRYLRSPWLWCGAAVAVLVMLPNMVWQIQHHFVSFEFLKSIHARDIRWGWTNGFLLNQFWKCANTATVPLWCAGLWYLFAVPDGKRFRLLGWMYVVSLLAFLFAKGRDYYLAPAYPMLLAAGRLGRAVGAFTQHSLRFESATNHLESLGGGRPGRRRRDTPRCSTELCLVARGGPHERRQLQFRDRLAGPG